MVYILWNSQKPNTLSARVGFYVGCCSRRLPFRASSHHCLIDLLLVATASLSIAACRVVFLLYHVHSRAIGSLHLRCGAPQSVHSTLRTESVHSHLPVQLPVRSASVHSHLPSTLRTESLSPQLSAAPPDRQHVLHVRRPPRGSGKLRFNPG